MNQGSSVDGFKAFLLRLADEIDSETLKKLLFASSIPNGKQEKIKTPIQFFDALIGREELKRNDTKVLEELLKSAGQYALSEKVKSYRIESITDQGHLNNFSAVAKYGLQNKDKLFTGRDDFVKSVADQFTVQKEDMVVILGPPGFGKSSVIIHIGHALYEGGMSIIFVSLRGTTSLHDMGTKILTAIDLENKVSNDTIMQVQNVIKSIQRPMVLILDNCEDIQKSSSADEFSKFIEYVVKYGSQVKLLLGTRKAVETISFQCQTQHIQPLSVSDSAKLIKAFIARNKVTGKQAEILGERCYGVPLLIKLAGAKVNNGYKPDELAKNLKNNFYDVLKLKDNQIQKCLIDSIRVFLDNIDKDMLDSLVKLSQYPSVFTDEEVCDLFIKDSVDCSNMLCRLRGNALLQSEGDCCSLHPLLQTFCRNREEQKCMKCTNEGDKARKEFTLHYLHKLETIQEKFQGREFQDAMNDFEHDRLNINQAMENALDPLSSKSIKCRCIDAYNNSVNFLGKIMQPNQCLEIYEQLYYVAMEMEDIKRKAECLVSKGFRHLCDGKHKIFSEEAFQSFHKAFELFKGLKKKERKTESFAHCQSKLGLCYIYRKERQIGKKLMQGAVSLRQELGNQVLQAASYCDKAIAARLSNEHSQAITIILEQCLPKYKENLEDHPWSATLYNYLSDSSKELGRLDDAIQYIKQSLEIRLKTLGDHQDTARAYVELAKLHEEGENLEEALFNYKKALLIQEVVLGDHEETKASYQAIADVSGKLNKEAEELIMREKADLCQDAINKRVEYQRLLSDDKRERANTNLERKKKRKRQQMIIIMATIVLVIIGCIYQAHI